MIVLEKCIKIRSVDICIFTSILQNSYTAIYGSRLRQLRLSQKENFAVNIHAKSSIILKHCFRQQHLTMVWWHSQRGEKQGGLSVKIIRAFYLFNASLWAWQPFKARKSMSQDNIVSSTICAKEWILHTD